jgi:hypothetical protein
MAVSSATDVVKGESEIVVSETVVFVPVCSSLESLGSLDWREPSKRG